MGFQVIRQPIYTDDVSTLGTVKGEGLTPLFSLELPWRNNEPNTSCIPAGKYQTILAWSNRYRRVMPRLLNVPGRTGVLVHSGNTIHDTHGCILVGLSHEGKTWVGESRKAFDLFFQWLSVEMRDGPSECEVLYE